MSATLADLRVRGLRGIKPKADPWRAHGALVEEERRPNGSMERALTIFLTGSECPFTCVFCDLWRFTIDGPTPGGALPRQIADTLESVESPLPQRVKLYNASNFFEPRAVPPGDLPAIAELCGAFSGVTVESHANTIGERTLEFARLIPGKLEVAIGLETIHPKASATLNKRLDRGRFERAAGLLGDNGIDLRVFVLLGAPNVPVSEAVEWAVRTAMFAATRGAAVVALIPVRGGNGEMERLEALGQFTPPTLSQLESALDRCLQQKSGSTVFTTDLWDVDRLAGCPACRAQRVARLRQLNATGVPQPVVSCVACAG